jgi:hypothetical protein
MIDPRKLKRLDEVLRDMETLALQPAFLGFWRAIIAGWAAELDSMAMSEASTTRGALGALARFLGASDGSAVVEHDLRKALQVGHLTHLESGALPGSRDDPTTPLGFYRCLSSAALAPADGFDAWFPYSLAVLERGLQGSAVSMCAAATSQEQLDPAALAAIGATADGVLGSTKEMQRLRGLATLAIDDLVLGSPFLVLHTPLDYYQFGSRFYAQADMDLYKCALTSGCVIPEDYYGEAFYEEATPGISALPELSPGSFHSSTIASNAAWRELAKAAVLTRSRTEEYANPLRPVYFDTALANAELRRSRIHVAIDVERTGRRLRDRFEKWAAAGLGVDYMRDAEAILAHFLTVSNLDIRWIRSFDTAWRAGLPVGEMADLLRVAPRAGPELTSLLSEGICVYTSRGPLSAVNRGFWVNPSVVNYIQPSSSARWELIPMLLLGLPPDLPDHSDEVGGHMSWLRRYVQEPTLALFRESRFLQQKATTAQEARSMARGVVEELLRPRLDAVRNTAERDFLTLADLTGVFDRSYTRLRHWIQDYRLGDYSAQAHDHRFTYDRLLAFVQEQLVGRRGFPETRVQEILGRINQAFRRQVS